MIDTNDSSLSRNDIIQWINDTLKLNLSKIEQLGTGAVHCQLLDIVYPGKVPLHKVNWKAKFEYEFVYNFKILQQSFTRFNIAKLINVEKLVKAKYQDNLEFAQWMLKFVQANTSNIAEYDSVIRRGNTESDFMFTEKPTTSAKPSITKDPSKSSLVKCKPSGIPAPKHFAFKSDSLNNSKTTIGGSYSNSNSMANLHQNLGHKDSEILTDITNFIDKQKADVEKSPQFEIVRAERDFYYSKLRDIDHILDVYKGADVDALMRSIREVLYLQPEEIAIVCEDGNIKIKNRDNEDDAMKEENLQRTAGDPDSHMTIEDPTSLSENFSQSLL